MQDNCSLTMNGTASNTNAAAIQVLTFFLEDTSIFLCMRTSSITTVSESGNQSNAHIIGVRKRIDSQKGVREGKSLGNPIIKVRFGVPEKKRKSTREIKIQER